MRLFLCFIGLLLLAPPARAAQPMRPYSGIGVLSISSVGLTSPIPFYDEPGLVRRGILAPEPLRQLTGWLFDSPDRIVLLVTGRKGNWLRVERDEAGRESWLLLQRHWQYTSWPQFLKGRHVVFLPNSPKRLMQVVSQPDSSQGTPRSAAAPPMRVVMVQEDWAYVLLDASSAGWVRWRDADGRLLIGFREEPSRF